MKNRPGFTLIEVVLVIVLTGILSSVIIPVLLQAVLSMHYHQTRTAVVSSCRVSMDRLGMEIRRIRSAADITTMTSGSIAFTDVAGNTITANVQDGDTDDADELRLVYNGAASILSTFVDQFTFTYYDSDGVVIDPSDADAAERLRTVRMTGRFSPVGDNMFDQPYDLTTEVRPPNLVSEEAILP